MTANAPFFLAMRYLRPRRSFVSVISVISVLGVALGVLMMIVVRAVMLGFEHDFRESLLHSEPHLLITPAKDAPKGAGAPDWEAMTATLRTQPEVLSASPYVNGLLYAEGPRGQAGAALYGLDPKEAGAFLQKLRSQLLDGSLALAEGTIVLTDESADGIGVTVGDEISVYESGAVKVAAQDFRAAMDLKDKEAQHAAWRKISLHAKKFHVSGILRGDQVGYIALAATSTARQIFSAADSTAGVALELRAPDDAKAAAARFAALVGTPQLPLTFKTWMDDNEARLAAMKNEQFMMRLLILVITLVAAFSVMNTTITVTTQKRREIGVLTALGCRERQIVSIFVIQAGVVAGLGVLLGLLGSTVLLAFRNEIRGMIASATGGQVHAIEGVFLAEIPARVETPDVMFAVGVSMLLCLAAAFLPAWRAARIDAAVALRD